MLKGITIELTVSNDTNVRIFLRFIVNLHLLWFSIITLLSLVWIPQAVKSPNPPIDQPSEQAAWSEAHA